jgi:hypothetical protein
MYRGVAPLLIAVSTAAPRASSSRTISKWPSWLATYSGVKPLLLAVSTAAPRASNSRTTSNWPL